MIFCHIIQRMIVHISTKTYKTKRCTNKCNNLIISYLLVALGLPCMIEVKYPNIVKLSKHPIFFLTTCQKEVALIIDV